jgi:hypothetical protein
VPGRTRNGLRRVLGDAAAEAVLDLVEAPVLAQQHEALHSLGDSRVEADGIAPEPECVVDELLGFRETTLHQSEHRVGAGRLPLLGPLPETCGQPRERRELGIDRLAVGQAPHYVQPVGVSGELALAIAGRSRERQRLCRQPECLVRMVLLPAH